MSGIVGLFRESGAAADTDALGRMLASIAHRGPHGMATWSDGPVGFGHAALRTTPEALRERQPVVAADGQYAITADVRLDNREDLIAELGLSRPSIEITDAELILAAYLRWGEACAAKLLGDFSFAVWDQPRRRLYCARDHFGAKPFCYFHRPRQLFAFASEIKALLCLTDVSTKLNELAIADHLVPQYFDTASTYYADILRLPPAHYLIVAPESVRLERYWSLDPGREVRLPSDEDYAEAFRDLFTQAVRARMRSAVPVGSMLSGGLDSSSISCVARNIHAANNRPSGWRTFSAVHKVVTQCDESEYINAVLAQGGYEATFFQADDVSPIGDVDRVLWHLDQPLVGGNLYLDWGLYGAAQQGGVGVMLDGFDGDTTVSHGLGYFVQLATSSRWLKLATEVMPYAKNIGESPTSVLWSWLWSFGLDPMTRNTRGVRRLRRWVESINPTTDSAVDHSENWLAIFNPDFANRADPLARRALLDGVLSPTERATHHRRLTDPGMPNVLEVLDRAGSAFGIEVRFPFWDRRLAEFCLSVPPEQKIRRGWTRMILRRAMDGILPRSIQWRPSKTNHHAAFERGMLTFEHDRMKHVVYEDADRIAPYVDVANLRDRFSRSLSTGRSDSNFNVVWLVVSLALWLRHIESATGSLAERRW